MVPAAPCKDCEKREFGCHDRCPEYQQFKKEKLQYNLQVAKIKNSNVYFETKAKENASNKRKHKK